MKRKLVALAVAVLTAASMLSCASAPKYHMFEGPPRLEMKVPYLTRTGQAFILQARLLGANAALPFDQYITVIVKANDMVMGVRSFILKDRNLTGTVILTADFFNTFKGYRTIGLDNPMDHAVPTTGADIPIEGVDVDDMDLKVTIEMEIWLSEINYKNELQPVKRILHKTAKTRLTCMEQACQSGMY